MKTFEGKLVSQNIKIGIVAARFNEFITSKLLSGAMDGLLRHDVQEFYEKEQVPTKERHRFVYRHRKAGI